MFKIFFLFLLFSFLVIAGQNLNLNLEDSRCPTKSLTVLPDKGLISFITKYTKKECDPLDITKKENKYISYYFDERNGEGSPVDSVGKLSSFWDKKMIGSDLANNLLRTVQSREKLPKMRFSVVENGAEISLPKSKVSKKLLAEGNKIGFEGSQYHGKRVVDLIANEPPFGISPQSKLKNVYLPVDINSFPDLLKKASEDKSDVINVSGALYDYFLNGDITKSLKNLAEKKTVVVAAGNSFPYPVQYLASTSSVITVGTLEPNGLKANFSQEGAAIDVWVPGGNFTNILEETLPLKRFVGFEAGTSFQAPIVTGAILNLKSLIPSVTTDEIKTLLKRTSIGTASSLNDGQGSFNYYKLLKVAARLKKDGWPKNREKINSTSLYDFSDEALKAYDKGILALKNNNCDGLNEGLASLRQAFFLDSDNKKTRYYLSFLYDSLGYKTEAIFYGGKSKNEALDIQETFDPVGRFVMEVRNQEGGLNDKQVKFLQDHMATLTSNPRSEALISFALFYLGAAFFDHVKVDKSQFIRIMPLIVEAYAKMPTDSGSRKSYLKMLKEVFSNKNEIDYMKRQFESRRINGPHREIILEEELKSL